MGFRGKFRVRFVLVLCFHSLIEGAVWFRLEDKSRLWFDVLDPGTLPIHPVWGLEGSFLLWMFVMVLVGSVVPPRSLF